MYSGVASESDIHKSSKLPSSYEVGISVLHLEASVKDGQVCLRRTALSKRWGSLG